MKRKRRAHTRPRLEGRLWALLFGALAAVFAALFGTSTPEPSRFVRGREPASAVTGERLGQHEAVLTREGAYKVFSPQLAPARIPISAVTPHAGLAPHARVSREWIVGRARSARSSVVVGWRHHVPRMPSGEPPGPLTAVS